MIIKIKSGEYRGGWFVKRKGYILAQIITKEGDLFDNAPGNNPIKIWEWYFWLMPLREYLMWKAGYSRKGIVRIIRKRR